MFCTGWLLTCRSLPFMSAGLIKGCDVLPVEPMLAKLPVVPVGGTGTLPSHSFHVRGDDNTQDLMITGGRILSIREMNTDEYGLRSI